MFETKVAVFGIALIALVFVCDVTSGLPSYTSPYTSLNRYTKRYEGGGIDFIQICLNNCGQCKKMFGDYFHGQMCAESCLKFKGKSIPDCEDIASIAPFVNAID